MQTLIRLSAVGVVLALLVVSGCGDSGPTTQPETASLGRISGHVTIDGESDHSGTRVTIQRTINGASEKVLAMLKPAAFEATPVHRSASDSDTTVTDITGYFEFLNVPAGIYAIYAERANTLAAFRTDIIVSDGSQLQLQPMTLTPTGSVSGIVLLEGEMDHAGIVVFVAGTSYAAYSDSTGAYSITGVPTGTHALMAAHWGFETVLLDAVAVTAGQVANAGTATLSRSVPTAPFIPLTFPGDGSIVTIPNVMDFDDYYYYNDNALEIVIHFSTAMDWTTVKDAISISPPLTNDMSIRGSAVVMRSYTDHWTPTPLYLNTHYTVTVDTEAKDIFGNHMANPFQFSFTTGPLGVGSTNPADGSRDVLPAQYAISITPNSTLAEQHRLSNSTVTFSPELSGTWDGEWDFYEYGSFQLTSPLRSDTEYEVIVEGIKDIHGNELPEPYRFSFATTGVRLVAFRPDDGATEVSPSTALDLTFTASMAEELLVSELVVTPEIELAGISGWGDGSRGRSYSIRPVGSYWPADTQITIGIPASITDYYGVSISNPSSFTFTTSPFRGTRSSPPDGTTRVTTTPYSVSASFNCPVDLDSVERALSISPPFAYTLHTGEPTAVVLRPTGPLAHSTRYTVAFSRELTTVDGTALSVPYSFSFTTRDE